MNSEIKDVKHNQIRKIRVESLFGLFDYDIPLNGGGVTILIGVNGSGKTTIFKILDSILKKEFYNILDIDFKSFEVYYENGGFIKCKRDTQSVNVNDLLLNIDKNERLNNYDDFLRGIRNLWTQSKLLYDFSITINSNGSTLKDTLITLSGNKNTVDYKITEMSSELNTILDELVTESRFIETQRLQLNYTGVDDVHGGYEIKYLPNNRIIKRRLNNTYLEDDDVSTSKSRIQEYADDLSKIIKSKRSNYFAESQDVEKKTLSEYLGKTNINSTHRMFEELKDIESNISEMDTHISKLSNLGIYNPDEMSHIRDSKLLYGAVKDIKQYIPDTAKSAKSIKNWNKLLDYSLKSSLLKSYAENMKKKLEIFEDLEGKIEIFTTHINTLFKYKDMKVDLEKGFVFSLNEGSEKGRVINPIDLSSGEQHEVILNYELIFKTDNNSVILIDEPEISLHMLWQRKFIDNLLDIAQENSLNIIVATHSADIVHKHRNLVCVLSEI